MPSHYTDNLDSPIIIRYVGDGSKYYPGVPNNPNPFVYNGGAKLLKTLLDSGQFVLVSGTINVADTTLVPGAGIDYQEDDVVGKLLTTYNLPLPAAPTGLSLTPSYSQVALSWSSVATAVSYNVYRAIHNGALTLLATGIVGTTYTDNTPINGTNYDYTISAVNVINSEGPQSSISSATPAASGTAASAPTGLTASSTASTVAFLWTAPSTGTAPITYTLKRGTVAGGPYNTTVASNISGTSYTDTTVSAGSNYYYTLTPYNSAGPGTATSELGLSTTPSSPITITDNFTRADTTAGLGLATTGQQWQHITGTPFKIQSNLAYAQDNTANPSIDSIDIGTPNVTATFINPNVGGFLTTQLALRYTSPTTYINVGDDVFRRGVSASPVGGTPGAANPTGGGYYPLVGGETLKVVAYDRYVATYANNIKIGMRDQYQGFDSIPITPTKHGVLRIDSGFSQYPGKIGPVTFAPYNKSNKILLAFHSNSLGFGVGMAGDTNPVFWSNMENDNAVVFNWSTGGYTTLDLINNAPTVIDNHLESGYLDTWSLMWEGTNDYSDAPTTYNHYVTYCQARKTAGWSKVAVGTVLPRPDRGTSFLTDRITINNNILAHYPDYADAVFDVAGDPVIGPNGASANTDYYFDTTHCVGGGYRRVVNYLESLYAQLGMGNKSVLPDVVYDNFTRADSTTALGTGWTALDGTWGISSNQAYYVSGGTRPVAVYDSGVSDGSFGVTCNILANSTSGLVFRATDKDNYWVIKQNNGYIDLYKRVAGVETKITNSNNYVAPPNNVTWFHATCDGPIIRFYQNGSLGMTISDNFNQTATKHGLTAGTADTASRFRNFTVDSMAVRATPTITNMSPTTGSNSSSVAITVNGTNFVSGARIRVGSAWLTTTFVNNTRLTATIAASTLSTAGQYHVFVRNPDNQECFLRNGYTATT